MQAIDTNLLVRLFVNDDAAQAGKARALFDRHADEDGSLWIADIVLVEMVWALDRAFGRSTRKCADCWASSCCSVQTSHVRRTETRL